MPKLHHKLQYLTRYLNQDLKLANGATDNAEDAVDLATATVGVALHDMSKAVKIRPVVAASQKTYRNQQNPYNLKAAILVSRHRIISGSDYQRLNDDYDRLASDQTAAKRQLPLPRRKFLGIF